MLRKSTNRPFRKPHRQTFIFNKVERSRTAPYARHRWFWPIHEPVPYRWAGRSLRLKRLRALIWRRLETKSGLAWRWHNFAPTEMGCRHCGETYDWPDFMDALQNARDRVGRPFRILSAHRCPLHNARVGGAPKSQHLRLAVDIATRGHDRADLYAALQAAGFTGFGFYTTFIHADMGRARQWFGSRSARDLWQT